MRSAGTDFVIAAGAPVGLDGSGGGDRPYFVFVAVGPGFQAARNRQRPSWLLPT
jgi:hypothetical protein